MKRQNWYLVVNADATILAVYGSALGDDATAKARELNGLGPVALRLIASRRRPHVGERLTAASLSIAF